MNIPNGIFSLLLKAVMGLACTLTSISYAQSNVRDVFSDSFNVSSSPTDVDFRRRFAKSIRQIIQDGLSTEKISKEFGWRVLEEKRSKETGRTVTIFDLYGKESNPSLTYFSKVKKSSFSTQLAPEYVCLRSEDVMDEFGKNFKPALLNVDSWGGFSSSLPKKSPSETVKKNWELFSWGQCMKCD